VVPGRPLTLGLKGVDRSVMLCLAQYATQDYARSSPLPPSFMLLVHSTAPESLIIRGFRYVARLFVFGYWFTRPPHEPDFNFGNSTLCCVVGYTLC
jgi:hypothetical protein